MKVKNYPTLDRVIQPYPIISQVITAGYEDVVRWLTPKKADLYRAKVLQVLNGDPAPKELRSAQAFMSNFLSEHALGNLSKLWKKYTGKAPFSYIYLFPGEYNIDQDEQGAWVQEYKKLLELGLPRDWYSLHKLDENTAAFEKLKGSVKDPNLLSLINTLLEMYADLKPVMARMKELEGSGEDRQKKKKEENFLSQIKNPKALQMVSESLRSVCDKLHKDLVKYHQDSITGNVKSFESLIRNEAAARQEYLAREKSTYRGKYGGHRDEAKRIFPKDKEDFILNKATKEDLFKRLVPADLRQYYSGTSLLSNSDALILKTAEAIAADMENTFVSKQVSKLAAITDKRPDFEKIEVVSYHFKRGAIEADVKLSFKNGDSFIAHTIIVFVVNQNGTHFFRYPTTFHAAVLNGERHAKVNESWMNNVFAQP